MTPFLWVLVGAWIGAPIGFFAWERHPGGFGRRQFYRRRQGERE